MPLFLMIVERAFTITGMMCAGCVGTVEKHLRSTDGVIEVTVNLMEGRTLITYDDRVTSPEQLRSAVRSIGYDMLIEERASERERIREVTESRALRVLLVKLVLTVVLSVVMMLPMWVSSVKLPHWFTLLGATFIMLWSAGDYHVRAFRQLHHGSFTMDTLISMSTMVAFVASLVGYGHYLDVVGMIVSFVLLGRYIEERAKYRTNDALRQLLSLAPDTAHVQRSGVWIELPLSEVVVGDCLRMRHGDSVPVDGRLLGTGTFDESSITGEPLPITKESGEEVFAGTISVGQVVEIIATKVGEETLLGRVVESVRRAQATKAPIQRIADKVSGIFVPVILGIAFVTLLAWGWSGSWEEGIFYAINVMVIACPCALGLATPTAITVAMGRASSMGLLVKDAVALEHLGRVTDVIYDKTGTLTVGHPKVVGEVWLQRTPEEEALLVKAEQMTSHPLSVAIMSKYSSLGSEAVPESLLEIPGSGIYFEHNGEGYRVGSQQFVWPEGYSGATLPPGSQVYYATDSKLIAVLVIDDEIRAEVPSAIEALQRKHNVQVHLLSGDKEGRVLAFADEAGIVSAKGGCSPLDKKAYITSLQSEGKVVAMVGDGINDSPALATADLSVAIGSGSDIATNIAQLTVVSTSPYAIERAICLSKETRRIIHQNFFWAFFYNMLAVPTAAGLFAPTFTITPMIAAAAMAFSSVTVVLNSLRLRRIRL